MRPPIHRVALCLSSNLACVVAGRQAKKHRKSVKGNVSTGFKSLWRLKQAEHVYRLVTIFTIVRILKAG